MRNILTNKLETMTETHTDFSDFQFAKPILEALEAEKYTTPTPIQRQAIPLVLGGGDLLGIAQTGTGKTAAFALPSLNHICRNTIPRPPKSARVLVLAPTRELAGQIAKSYQTYGQFFKPSVCMVVGGVNINRQIRELSRGVDVLVATPGRLIDLMGQNAVTLKHVEILVLDEADQMLDMGFIHALRKIVPMVPKKRQTLFFSATMPRQIADLAKQFLTDPAKVSVAPQATTAERVTQRLIFVSKADKPALLTLTIQREAVQRALVFTRTKHGADRVVRQLGASNIKAAAIHGNKSQPQRERALAAFRSGETQILIATDIAARGIDIPGVSHVINYDLPNVPEQYVHRIGRTARAGASGEAISFVDAEEKAYLKAIEKVTRQAIPVAPLPEDFIAAKAEIKTRKLPPKRSGNSPARRSGQKPPSQRSQNSATGKRGNRKPKVARDTTSAATENAIEAGASTTPSRPARPRKTWGKTVGKTEGNAGGKTERRSGGRPGGKSSGKPSGKPGSKSRAKPGARTGAAAGTPGGVKTGKSSG
ncbi:MAG: DEAD/DEAH box helicase, partial [Parvularculaceae bacterium]